MIAAAVPWLAMLAITGVLVAVFPLAGALVVASGLALLGGKRAGGR